MSDPADPELLRLSVVVRMFIDMADDHERMRVVDYVIGRFLRTAKWGDDLPGPDDEDDADDTVDEGSRH